MSDPLLRLDGPGEPVEVSEVGRSLARIWAEATRPQGERILRACQGNLVVWISAGASVEGVVEEATRARPVRVLLLEEAPAQTPLRARISALCHLRGDHERICCERIRLARPEGGEDRTVGAVRSLLRGGLPVLLWCPGDPPLALPAFQDLCHTADLLLVNSSVFADPLPGLRWLRDLQRDAPPVRPLDETWWRLADWRRAVHRHFDPLPVRERIPTIQRLRVRGAPAPSLLLAGWVVSCLGRTDLAVEITDGEDALEFHFALGPPVTVVPGQREHRGEGPPGALARWLGKRQGEPLYERALEIASAPAHGERS